MRGAAVAVLILSASCGGEEAPGPQGQSPPAATDQAVAEITVTSPAFAEGDAVPVELTCDGANESPPLEWSGVPEGAAELHVILEDPDAPIGTFTHWNVTGIPPATASVDQGTVPEGGTETPTDIGAGPYGGPCPPPGDPPHRYVFIVRALDAGGQVIGEGSLTGLYRPAD